MKKIRIIEFHRIQNQKNGTTTLSLSLSLTKTTHTQISHQVVYAAAILSKSGKLLLSRQYADMQRIRVEGLLAAFTKLLADNSSKQHTFVETPQVRYLYHPLENMYVLLVTNKSSNIMEDLDTLRLLSKIVRNFFVFRIHTNHIISSLNSIFKQITHINLSLSLSL